MSDPNHPETAELDPAELAEVQRQAKDLAISHKEKPTPMVDVRQPQNRDSLRHIASAYPSETDDSYEPETEELDPSELEAIQKQAVQLEITDVLDLHTFPPAEVKNLVRDYLDLAYEKGLRHLRIIHGKGTGTQKRIVHSLLDRDPRVVEYGDPPGQAGGWGATWVIMS